MSPVTSVMSSLYRLEENILEKNLCWQEWYIFQNGENHWASMGEKTEFRSLFPKQGLIKGTGLYKKRMVNERDFKTVRYVS